MFALRTVHITTGAFRQFPIAAHYRHRPGNLRSIIYQRIAAVRATWALRPLPNYVPRARCVMATSYRF